MRKLTIPNLPEGKLRKVIKSTCPGIEEALDEITSTQSLTSSIEYALQEGMLNNKAHREFACRELASIKDCPEAVLTSLNDGSIDINAIKETPPTYTDPEVNSDVQDLAHHIESIVRHYVTPDTGPSHFYKFFTGAKHELIDTGESMDEKTAIDLLQDTCKMQ